MRKRADPQKPEMRLSISWRNNRLYFRSILAKSKNAASDGRVIKFIISINFSLSILIFRAHFSLSLLDF